MSSLNFDRYMLIPFVSEGRTYDGCDCWGQLWLIYRDMVGFEVEKYEGIEASNLREIAKIVAEHKKLWPLVREPDKPRIFDVAVLRAQGSETLISHLGVMISPQKLIHTEEKTGPRVVKLDDPFIKNRLVEIRRHHKLVGHY